MALSNQPLFGFSQTGQPIRIGNTSGTTVATFNTATGGRETNALTEGQLAGLAALGAAGCASIPDPTWRTRCLALVAAGAGIGNIITGGGGTKPNTNSNTSIGTLAACPTGWKPNGSGGCIRDNITQYLPGDIGQADTGWTPVFGFYGAGVTPLAVQRIQRACPAGFVIGKDGVCYDHLARSNRAHNPGRKPLLTGGDMNALARARALQKTIGKIHTRFGPKKRPAFARVGKRK